MMRNLCKKKKKKKVKLNKVENKIFIRRDVGKEQKMSKT